MSQRPVRDAARRESAEALALRALAWLAADDGRLGAFLTLSGLSPAELSRQAGDVALLGAVLDHLLADEPALLDCAEDLGIPPASLASARAALPGGDVPHWT